MNKKDRHKWEDRLKKQLKVFVVDENGKTKNKPRDCPCTVNAGVGA